jgi:hypothetical protein
LLTNWKPEQIHGNEWAPCYWVMVHQRLKGSKTFYLFVWHDFKLLILSHTKWTKLDLYNYSIQYWHNPAFQPTWIFQESVLNSQGWCWTVHIAKQYQWLGALDFAYLLCLTTTHILSSRETTTCWIQVVPPFKRNDTFFFFVGTFFFLLIHRKRLWVNEMSDLGLGESGISDTYMGCADPGRSRPSRLLNSHTFCLSCFLFFCFFFCFFFIYFFGVGKWYFSLFHSFPLIFFF